MTETNPLDKVIHGSPLIMGGFIIVGRTSILSGIYLVSHTSVVFIVEFPAENCRAIMC